MKAFLLLLALLGVAPAAGPAQPQSKAGKAELDAAFQKGIALHKAGKSADAVPFLDRAVKLADEVFGPDDLSTAAILNTAGLVYAGAGREREAEPLQRRSLQIREARLGKDHPVVASTLSNLASCCAHQFRNEEAEALLRRCLAIREARLRPQDPALGQTCHALGKVNADLGRYRDAEALYRRALALQELPEANQPDALANTLNSYSLLCRQLGKLDEAEALAVRGLKLREATHGKESEEVALALNALGLIYGDQARYREGESALRRCLQLREGKFGEDRAELARVLNNLALLYARQERYDEAEPAHRRALVLREARFGKDHPDVANSLANLSVMLGRVGRLEEAEQLCRRALAIREARLGKDHPLALSSSNNLALLLRELGRPREAEPLLKRCIRAEEVRSGEDGPGLAIFLDNLALVYNRTNRLEEALPLSVRALRIRRKRLGEDHPETFASLTNTGMLLNRLGRKREAEALLRKALGLQEARFGKEHPSVGATLQNLAVLNQGLGRSREALELLQRSLRISRSGVSNVLAFSSESAMSTYLEQASGRLPLTVSLASACPPEEGAAEVGLTWALRLKGLVLETLCRYRQAERLLAPDDALSARLTRYRGLKQRIANAAVAPPQQASPEELEKQMQAWRTEAEDLERELNRAMARAPSAARDDWEEVDAATVRRKLLPRSALVEFVRAHVYDFQQTGYAPPHYFAFVLTAAGPPRLFDLGEAGAIDAGVEAVRKEFTDFQEKLRDCESPEEALALEKTQEQQFQKVSAALRQRLLGPLEGALAGAELLYLVPDGNLNRLPFEPLADGNGKYLVENCRCAYLSSGRDLLRPAPAPARGTVVFAGPDFKLGGAERTARASALLGTKEQVAARGAGPELRSAGWKALPGAAAEAGDIQKALAGSEYRPVKIFVGGDALEEVLKALPAPRLLHLATHGFSLDREAAEAPDPDAQGAGAARGRLRRLDNPLLRSGVVLAGANAVGAGEADSRSEDGWVTAEEIALLDLHGCELVVLSACQTGLGDVRSGEGVYGLRRAFLYAGARSLVTSLFEVPDRETRALMQRFYTNLAAGRGRLEALHGAQVEMLRQRRQQGGAAHPFFWASFVLVGDPG